MTTGGHHSSAPPRAYDDATAVAELPAGLLAFLRSGAELEVDRGSDPDVEIGDLVDLGLDSDESTMRMETVTYGAVLARARADGTTARPAKEPGRRWIVAVAGVALALAWLCLRA